MVETIEADFVVIGAGSAGCVMAAWLSEDDPGTRVVLLEARRRGNQSLDPYPVGVRQEFCERGGQLVLRNGGQSEHWRAEEILAARQGAGWIELDQWHGVYTRAERGF